MYNTLNTSTLRQNARRQLDDKPRLCTMSLLDHTYSVVSSSTTKTTTITIHLNQNGMCKTNMQQIQNNHCRIHLGANPK